MFEQLKRIISKLAIFKNNGQISYISKKIEKLESFYTVVTLLFCLLNKFLNFLADSSSNEERDFSESTWTCESPLNVGW